VPVALSWLLAEEDLALRLVTSAASDVEVDWAHAIELEDPTPWLTGGELVLTTGLRLPRSRTEQTTYVDRLTEVGVAALAFGVGVRFTAIPRGVVDQCEKHGMPLLEVPLPTPFIAVTQRVAQRLAHEQQRALQRVVKSQQTITRRSLRDGPPGVVDSLAHELAREVVLLDEHDRPLWWGRSRGLVDVLAAELAPGRRSRRPRSTHRVDTSAGPMELHALTGRAAHRGWLAVGLAEPLSADDRLLVNHAVAVATLQLDRPREVEQARASVGATILGLLLEHTPSSPEMVRHLTHLGFTRDAPVRMVSARAAPAAPLADAAQASLAAAGIPHALQTTAGTLMVLVQDRDIDEAVAAIQSSVLDAGQRPGGLGVSGAVAPEFAGDALVQARQAGEVARDERLASARFDTLTLGAVLSDSIVRERVQSLTRSTIEPLLGGDDEVLAHSLQVFLEHNGAWESAARALAVHRHTLRHRMARVEELTGLDLDVSHNRVVLQLALATRPGQRLQEVGRVGRPGRR
jgi:PucR family transcriptional regulator, purine catabolism regulatory protein